MPDSDQWPDRFTEILNDERKPVTPSTADSEDKVGIEGTGSYGAGLARYLASKGIDLVEVDRPDRKTRRNKGKSDPIDAIAAARAAVSGQATGTPKTRTGPVEAIRAMRVARRGAVKARTAALNQLHGLIASAPETLRAELAGLPPAALIRVCAMRHDPRTKAYVQRRTQQGLSKKEIMRCLKRYIVREVHTALLADLTTLTPLTSIGASTTRTAGSPRPPTRSAARGSRT